MSTVGPIGKMHKIEADIKSVCKDSPPCTDEIGEKGKSYENCKNGPLR